MCGIFGYIGTRQAKDVILKGLRLLEYRGYDSAGIALADGGNIEICKKAGRIAALQEAVLYKESNARAGIGHMRWATHGRPSDENSHPFLSRDGRFSVVHNGIIDNYIEIKKELENNGYTFTSQTDTEVIPHLLEYYYKGDMVEAILAVVKRLRGTFALGILSACDTDKLYAVRKDSPLIIGLGAGENFLCSDTNTLQHFTGKIAMPANEQIAVITADKAQFFDFRGRAAKCKTASVKEKKEETVTNPDPFMYREIHEIPEVLEYTCNYFSKNDILRKLDKEFLKRVKRIYVVGCGTAMHAAFMAMTLLRKYCKVDVFPGFASEFKHENFLFDENTLTIAVSQSGETADTLAAVKKARDGGSRVLSITNVNTSSIVGMSDFVLNTFAGPEIAVASTKAYNCQLMTLFFFVLNFAFLRGEMTREDFDKMVAELQKIPKAAEKALETAATAERLASENFSVKSVFFLGRGPDFYLAKEGSLKLKELSYINSEAYPAGELKHGTLAIVEEGVLIVAPVTQTELLAKTCGSLSEVKTRGGRVIAVSQFKAHAGLKQVCDSVINVPPVHEDFMAIVAVIPMFLFSYYMALHRGCDVDRPRNLAKSVTVE